MKNADSYNAEKTGVFVSYEDFLKLANTGDLLTHDQAGLPPKQVLKKIFRTHANRPGEYEILIAVTDPTPTP